MEEFVLFIICFLLVLIIYEIFIISPMKKKKKKKRELIEIRYLISKYGINIKNIDYDRLLQVCAFTSSFDIAIVVSIMEMIDNFWFKIIIGFISIFIVIMISYYLVYLYIRRKIK